jgi:hypothetical protein
VEDFFCAKPPSYGSWSRRRHNPGFIKYSPYSMFFNNSEPNKARFVRVVKNKKSTPEVEDFFCAKPPPYGSWSLRRHNPGFIKASPYTMLFNDAKSNEALFARVTPNKKSTQEVEDFFCAKPPFYGSWSLRRHNPVI